MKLAMPMLLTVTGTSLALAQGSLAGRACDDGWSGGRRTVTVCEVRELTLPVTDALSIDGGGNGAVTVTGRDQNEIGVRAQVRAWARNDDAARAILDEVTIDTDRGLRADGPRGRNAAWSVAFEVMAPRNTELSIESVNGAIAVADMRGDLDFDAVNGRVSLSNVTANVHGSTVNGAIGIEFDSGSIAGDVFDVRTTNGAVELKLPEGFSARLEVETVNGGIHVDFPVTVQGRIDRRALSTTLGDGGPLLRVRTVNGAVRLMRN
jgi:hypothetical protein